MDLRLPFEDIALAPLIVEPEVDESDEPEPSGPALGQVYFTQGGDIDCLTLTGELIRIQSWRLIDRTPQKPLG